jgi:D-alanyl-D-alanine carboxypeptidase
MNSALSAIIFAAIAAQVTPPQPVGKVGIDLEKVRSGVRARLAELHEQASFPGMTVGFVLPDGRSASVAVGIADRDKKIPMKVDDRMLAGSIGKTFVSAVALQLVGEGKLELESKISRWLGNDDWFPRLPNGPNITLRMLMNHSSGIPEHVLDPTFIAALRAQPDRNWSPPQLVAYVLGKPPLFPAGEGWSYADTNYILVGMIVERAAGRSLYDEIGRRLLTPLRLENTSPSITRVIAGLVPGYSRKGGPFDVEGPTMLGGKMIFNPQCEWAGGGFVSTSEDLASWGRLLYGGDVLTKDALDSLRSGVPAKTGMGDRYGLGVQIRNSPWGNSLGHGGWFPGYLSEMEYFSGPRLAVAVQFNTDDQRSLKRSPRFYVAEAARVILASVPDYPEVEKTDAPRIFAEGVVSTEDDEIGGVFNPQQSEFYFSKLAPYTTAPRLGLLCMSRRQAGRWTTPEVLPFSGRWLDLPPRLSPDGQTMYFGSSRPLAGFRARVIRIWSVARNGEAWGEPEPLPSPINEDSSFNWGASVAADRTIYFTSSRGPSGGARIYRSRFAEGRYAEPELLGPEINSGFSESDPFISPDGKRLFFVSTGDHGSTTRHRPSAMMTGGFPYARGDIYVSRADGGKWAPAKHLEGGVNSVGEEGSPALSPDGEFLFFTSERSPFVVPMAKTLDIDLLGSTLHSLENGHANVNYISVDALKLENTP